MAKSSCHTYGSYSIGRQYFKEKKKKKNICQQWLRKHRADKAFRKVRSLSKLRFRWTSNRFESPTFLSLTVGNKVKRQQTKNLNQTLTIMEKRVFKCLVASPGDTQEERKICEKIF